MLSQVISPFNLVLYILIAAGAAGHQNKVLPTFVHQPKDLAHTPVQCFKKTPNIFPWPKTLQKLPDSAQYLRSSSLWKK